MKNRFLSIALLAFLTACASRMYDAEAEKNISGTKIKVGLVHNHFFLSEYKRFIAINDGDPIGFGQDAGGSPFINVFEAPSTIILQTFHNRLLIINKHDQGITLTDRALDKNEVKHFIGKFDFDKSHGKREYTFIPNTVDPKFNPQVMRGG